MSHNKMLNAAIIAALSVSGGTAAQAASLFEVTNPANFSPTVAKEIFSTSANAEQLLPSADNYATTYWLGLENDVTAAFTVIYTLTGGVWDTHPLATQFSITKNDGSALDIEPSISYQEVTDTQVTYGVDANSTAKVPKDAKLIFKNYVPSNANLQIKVAEKDFATSGQEAILNIGLTGGITASEDLLLAKSGVGTAVSFTADTSDVKIDVGQGGGKKFKVGTTLQTYARLGTITINYPASRLKNDTLTTDWDFNGDNGVNEGELEISSGPFAASTKDQVFLDTNNTGCSAYESGTDIAASSVDSSGETAKWTLTESQLETLFGNTANICLIVSGNDAINETDNAPTATLTIDYKNGQQGVSYPKGNLRHTPKNGVICTAYLVTDGISVIDKSNIRVTNRSTSSGTLTGSLTDQEGNSVFADITLATIGANETFYLGSKELVEIAKEAGHSGEFGRGYLTIGSDLISLELFGLLRNNSVSGSGPLLNMSLGASGNGCD